MLSKPATRAEPVALKEATLHLRGGTCLPGSCCRKATHSVGNTSYVARYADMRDRWLNRLSFAQRIEQR